jgi:hypothetical protein
VLRLRLLQFVRRIHLDTLLSISAIAIVIAMQKAPDGWIIMSPATRTGARIQLNPERSCVPAAGAADGGARSGWRYSCVPTVFYSVTTVPLFVVPVQGPAGPSSSQDLVVLSSHVISWCGCETRPRVVNTFCGRIKIGPLIDFFKI